MEFVTIDFETANESRDSVCELGLTVVDEDKVADQKSWLIRPLELRFNSFNTLLHGISEETVADKPQFDQLWPEISKMLSGRLVFAHNAAFDISVLRSTLDSYRIDYPNIDYSCSYQIAKKVWPGLLKYDLKSLAKLHNISITHHRAMSDSEGCAKLILKAFSEKGVIERPQIEEKIGVLIGKLYPGGYVPALSKRDYSNRTKELPRGNPEKFKPEHPFYGKEIVFTGKLESMIRETAQQLVADIGGMCGKGTSRTTNYLVVGYQDFRQVGEDGKSNKLEKAEKLLNHGAEIEILSEPEFLRML